MKKKKKKKKENPGIHHCVVSWVLKFLPGLRLSLYLSESCYVYFMDIFYVLSRKNREKIYCVLTENGSPKWFFHHECNYILNTSISMFLKSVIPE